MTDSTTAPAAASPAAMIASLPGGLREEFDALNQRLASEEASKDLDALKRDIGALVKRVDSAVEALTALRGDVTGLIERWKTLRAAQPSIAPQFSGEKPVIQADHIGASTFIEKGWSKLSLGDYEGSEAALR